tara:strand:- start:1979 stop:3001 length:1023 start_codon:yes stop_codon:yes gene_type:complete
MGGASVVDGNIVPGANNSTLGVPVPAYAQIAEQQKLRLNPNYTEGGIVSNSDLNEYNVGGGGTLDRNLGGLGGQDTKSAEISYNDLTLAGQRNFDKGNNLIQEYKKNNSPGALPFGEKYDAYQKGLNKILDQNTLTVSDLNEAGMNKYNVRTNSTTGQLENIGFGGILNEGGTFDARDRMQNRIGGFEGTLSRGKNADGEDLLSAQGDTLEDTLRNSGMQLSANGQVGVPTAESLQYTGDNVAQMNPSIRDAVGGNGLNMNPAEYAKFSEMYLPKKAAAAEGAGLLGDIGGITGAVGLLGDIMLMQSLLDNKQKPTPGAGIPRGQAGAKIQVEDPYKRRF